MSTVPSLEALVYTAVRVFGGLGTRQLRLHARHSGAEGLSPCCVFLCLWTWSGGLRTRFPGVRLVVGGPTFGVQASALGFPFLARPCCGLSHRTP